MPEFSRAKGVAKQIRKALDAMDAFSDALMDADYDLEGVDAQELLDEAKEKVGEEGSLLDAIFDVLQEKLEERLKEEEGTFKPFRNPRRRS